MNDNRAVADLLVALSPLHESLSHCDNVVQEETLLDLYVKTISVKQQEGSLFRVIDFLCHPLRLTLKRISSSSLSRQLALRGLKVLVSQQGAVLKNSLALMEEVATCVGDFARDEDVRVAAVELLDVLLSNHVVQIDKLFWNSS
jgi:hypothetical protein